MHKRIWVMIIFRAWKYNFEFWINHRNSIICSEPLRSNQWIPHDDNRDEVMSAYLIDNLNGSLCNVFRLMGKAITWKLMIYLMLFS